MRKAKLVLAPERCPVTTFRVDSRTGEAVPLQRCALSEGHDGSAFNWHALVDPDAS